MEIFFILGIPLLLAIACLLIRSQRFLGILNCIGYLTVLFLSAMLLKEIALSGTTRSFWGFICLDTLSVFFIFVIAVVVFASALYSVGYIKKDIDQEIISGKKARIYYLLFNLFCCSMFFVPSVNNLGMLWVAIELTTLISAFLEIGRAHV